MGKLAYFLRVYTWFILRNLLGWILILGALAAGPLPGPGGIPLFLIGFALITFPGKRRFVARLLRGRQFAVTERHRWTRVVVRPLNALVRGLPKARMKIRPTLRRIGMRLLPPRWYRHGESGQVGFRARLRRHEDEILWFGKGKRKKGPGPTVKGAARHDG